ncbi:MAG: DUF177 domain-containing protein [Erysipelotrichaceae bacterium]|nr:DUF177 domain-containing protein [Erysipelotrichaceae bacterium]
MIIYRNDIKAKKAIRYDEDVIINIKDIASNPDIIEIKKVHVTLEAKEVVDLVVVDYVLKADLILRSTRSLKPVPYKIKEKVSLTLSFEENDYDDEDIIQVEDDQYDMYEEILSTLITSIPLKIIGKDEPETIKGDGWEVISEDDYYKKKKETIDPRFEKLLNLDLDDED